MTHEELANKFIEAGYGKIAIEWPWLELVGISKEQKTYEGRYGRKKINNFEDFCEFVYRKVTGDMMDRCPLAGRGFRSKWHGEKVAAAIRRKYCE